MDALKKAEEAKRAAGEGRTTDTQALRELELAPLEAKPADAPNSNPLQQPPTGVSPLPDLSLHIESVDADLAAADAHEPPNYSRSQVKTASGVLAWVYLRQIRPAGSFGG